MLRAVESAADDSVVATLSRRGPWYWDHRQWLVTSLHWDVDWCWWSSYSTDSAPYRLHSGKSTGVVLFLTVSVTAPVISRDFFGERELTRHNRHVEQ